MTGSKVACWQVNKGGQFATSRFDSSRHHIDRRDEGRIFVMKPKKAIRRDIEGGKA